MIKNLSMKIPKNTIHLASGSTCPPLKSDTLRVYSMFFCPYAQRTRMVLNAKNVKHETVNINLTDKPDWFLKINPLAKVPTFQFNDKIMFESMVTSDYINETYPVPPLYPNDPWAKGVDRCLIEVYENKVLRFFYKIFMSFEDKNAVVSSIESYHDGLDFFEAELTKRGTRFFFGDRPGMLDYALFPWFERIPIAKKLFSDLALFPSERFPKLTEYYEAMLKDEAAASTVANFDDHLKYLESRLTGNIQYDFGASSDPVLLSSNL